MKKIHLNLNERSYDIFAGKGAIRKLPEIIAGLKTSSPIVVVSDRTVYKKTRDHIVPVLKKLDNEVIDIIVPPGERSKSIGVFEKTIQQISYRTRRHKPVIIALGGGVIGDLAGFIAASYRRGVPLLQIPTTLLAQVDSSIGGKVGIDLPQAKNLVGAFCQPKAVIMDTDLLATLPKREIKNGLAEIIKYGIIKNRSFFAYLESNIDKVLRLEKTAMEKVISECASIKAIRIDLNFGHTFGHAIESASGYSKGYNHGEAISVGMMIACEVGVSLGMLKSGELERVKGLLRTAGLPVKARGVSSGDIMKAFAYDKKFSTGAVRMVVPNRIGTVSVVTDIPINLLRSVLKKYVG